MGRPRLHRRAVQRTLRLTYVDPGGNRSTCAPAEAFGVAFEDCRPVRTFTSAKNQRHTPGLFWSATTGAHIPYESRLERDWLLEADFDPRVIGISTQPFRVDCLDPDGSWRHTPDIFLRMADGSGHVRDVKNSYAAGRTDAVVQRERTKALCRSIGWSYDLVTELPAVRVANLNWLSAYRRPVTIDTDLVELILRTVEVPSTVEEITDATGCPEATLPLLFHLAWRQHIVFNLEARMTARTLFRRQSKGERR